MSQPILVAGGAGFIGSNLIEALISGGDHVVCVDNFDLYYPEPDKRANLAPALCSGRVRLEQVDIRDAQALRELVLREKPQAVVHLAARPGVRPSLEMPEVYLDINVRGTLNVLNACREAGVRRLVFASSSSVYGALETAADEATTPCRPLSPYGASKVAGEALCSSFAQRDEMSIVALRFFTVYGPRQRPDMAINKFARAISEGTEIVVYGDGHSFRDYTYIDDIVCGIIAALRLPGPGFEVFNLGGGSPVRLLDLVSVLEREIGRAAKIRFAAPQPGDPSMTFADISRARNTLGFSPATSIQEGIRRYVSWTRERHPETSL